MRRSPAVRLAVAVVAATSPALGMPSRQACVSAYEDAQTAMRRSHLREARSALTTCLNEACPAVLRADCAGWLKEVEARMPSVVIEATTGGAPVKDGALVIDGEPRDGGLDGKAMELDPGPHTFALETSGTKVSVDAVVREGEKLKVVRIAAPGAAPAAEKPATTARPEAPAPARATTTRRPVPWTVYAAAGVGAAAAVGFGVFALSGAGMKSDLEPCKPNCSQARLDDVQNQFILADVFLGVSAIAFGTATYLFFTRPTVQRMTGQLTF